YAYLPLAAFLAGLYAVWGWAATAADTRRPGSLLSIHASLLVGLVVLGIASGLKVREINVGVKHALRPLRVTVQSIKQLVDGHHAEPGFSFAFDDSAYATMNSFHGIPLPLILFQRYVNNHDPKYLFTSAGGKLVALPCSDGCALG